MLLVAAAAAVGVAMFCRVSKRAVAEKEVEEQTRVIAVELTSDAVVLNGWLSGI